MLGDDAAGAYVDGFMPAVAKQTQVEAILRAEAASLFDRGNRVTEFGFTATREFASLDELLSWYGDHIIELPTEGSVQISNANGAVLYLAAQLTRVRVADRRGVTLVMGYEFSGGEFTRTES